MCTDDCEITKHEGCGLNCLHVLWLINTNIWEEPATSIFYPEYNKWHVFWKVGRWFSKKIASTLCNQGCVNPKFHEWKHVFIICDHKYYKQLYYFSSEICNYRASVPGVIEKILRHTDMSCAASWLSKVNWPILIPLPEWSIVSNWYWYWLIFWQVITGMIGPCWQSSNFLVIWLP
jgi:hypothetical protein